jgi:hypothetical protein
MRRHSTNLRLIADSAVSSTMLTDTAGSPSESYHWSHMAAIRREWQHEFWHPHVDAFAMTLTEIRSIESRVRRELYP